MSRAAADDWDVLASEWARQAPPAPGVDALLRARVRRQGARLALVTAGEAVLAAAFLAGSAWLVLRSPDGPTIAWAAAVWVFTFACAGFALVNRRGIWRAEGATTRAYVDLTLERCRRRVRTARFVYALLAAEVAFIVPWTIWEIRSRAAVPGALPAGTAWRIGGIAALVAAFAAWAWAFRRRALREMEELLDLKRAIEEAGAPD
jgi:hypothetical protein